MNNIKMIFAGLIFCLCLNVLSFAKGEKKWDLFGIKDVLRESTYMNNVSETGKSSPMEIDNYKFAGGMVSVDCLRCLCLQQSNCRPIGCRIKGDYIGCGYFRFTHAFWLDCGIYRQDWRKCSNDVTCASQCVQNYMARYAKIYNCLLKCEGYSREFSGGPNGCNNPRTLPFWNAVQQQPGCKGVE